MSSCAKIATKIHVNHGIQHHDQESPPLKLHPEISNAIKRQNQTSGIDYLKLKYQGGTMVGGNQPRKSDTWRLHSLTMEFPEVGFPSVTHRLPKHPAQIGRVKKKVGLLGEDALNRSQTSVNLTAPSLHEKDKYTDQQTTPNKASVTDLTCLQFADTLFTPSASQQGLFGFSVNKVKYMDYLEECMTAKEKPLHKDSEMKEKRDKLSERLSVYKSPRLSKVTPKPLPLLPGKESKGDKPVSKSPRGKSNDDSHGKDKPPVKNNEKLSHPQDDHRQANNKKSILKQAGNPAEAERDATCVNNDCSVKDRIDCSKSKPKSKVIRNDLPQAVVKKDKLNVDSSVCVTVTASTTRRNGYTTCGLSVVSGNGRSVRFNKADEVFEYTPSEPIKIQ